MKKEFIFGFMRKYLFVLILSTPIVLNAQNNAPTFKNARSWSHDTKDKISRNKDKIQLFSSMLNTNNLLLDSSTTILEDSVASLKIENDSLEKLQTSTEDVLTFYGAAAVGTGTDFLSTLTSTGQLNAQINPCGKLYIGLGANLLFANPDNSVKKDSVGFNSLMFPETGKFGVLASAYYKFAIGSNGPNQEKRQHFLIPQFSFAYRRVSIDSPSIGFKVLNYNFGLKYQMECINLNSDVVTFSIMPYYHYFNIPDEDVKNFHQYVNDTLFSKYNANAELRALGIKTTLQFNSVVFFFDIRENLSTKNLIDTDPFKGTLMNVGFSTLFKIRLSKKQAAN